MSVILTKLEFIGKIDQDPNVSKSNRLSNRLHVHNIIKQLDDHGPLGISKE